MNKEWRVFCLAAVLPGLLYSQGCVPRERPAPPPVPPPAADSKPAPAKRAVAEGAGSPRTLFIIERNMNANVLHYDAGLTPDGALDPARPVVAYWVMLAEDGRRKKLNWLETKKAYGIKFKAAADGYVMTLAAAPWMPLAVKKAGAAVRVEALINGRTAVVEKMFIQARNKLLGPKVEYIDLYGKDLETGEPCRERVLPR